jgi:hypothetical protein
LTWEQLADWQRYYEQEPWGEIRADMRAAANSLWSRSCADDSPDLFHPYFSGSDPNELAKRAKLLDAKIAEIKSNGSQ